jgi:hypothetical protein
MTSSQPCRTQNPKGLYPAPIAPFAPIACVAPRRSELTELAELPEQTIILVQPGVPFGAIGAIGAATTKSDKNVCSSHAHCCRPLVLAEAQRGREKREARRGAPPSNLQQQRSSPRGYK